MCSGPQDEPSELEATRRCPTHSGFFSGSSLCCTDHTPYAAARLCEFFRELHVTAVTGIALKTPPQGQRAQWRFVNNYRFGPLYNILLPVWAAKPEMSVEACVTPPEGGL